MGLCFCHFVPTSSNALGSVIRSTTGFDHGKSGDSKDVDPGCGARIFVLFMV